MVERIEPPDGYSETEFGMVVPTQAVGSSLDLVRSYCSLEQLVGVKTSRIEVEEILGELPRLNLVTLLAKLTCHLEQSKEADVALQDEVCRAFAPARLLGDVLEMIAAGNVFTSRQVTLALAKLALRTGSEAIRDVAPQTAGTLLLALADVIYDDDKQAASNVSLSRLGLFSRSTWPGQAWGRYELLWRDIAAELVGHPSAVDLRKLVTEAFHLPWDVYESLAFACYLHFWERVNARRSDWYEGTPLTGTMVTAEEQETFFIGWSADETWFAAQPIEPLALEFSAFRKRPLLRNRQKGVAPVSLQFLLYKGTEGFLDGLADHLRAIEPRLSKQLRTWFGAIFERYVWVVLQDAVADSQRLISEDDLKAVEPRGRVCDAVIRYPRSWLLVEAHARRITYEGAVSGEEGDFDRDVRTGILDEARQLAGTVRALRKTLAERGDIFVPVVVVPWPFGVLPTTVRVVRELIGTDQECHELFRERVDPLVVMDSQDWETLIATSLKRRSSLMELIRAWQDSGYEAMNFETWAKAELGVGAVVPPSLAEARGRFHRRCLDTLFRRG